MLTAMGRPQSDALILILILDAEVTGQGQGQDQKTLFFSKFEIAP